MAVVNVKVGDLEVPMDLEMEHDARANIAYICKVLGFKPASILPQYKSSGPSYLNSPFNLRLKGAMSALEGGKSLKGLAVHSSNAPGGTPNDKLAGQNNPIPFADTVELYDPNNSGLQPPYPKDRTGGDYIPVVTLP